MARSVTLLVDHRHELALHLWPDGSATLAAISVPDGASARGEDLARVLEALATFARTGELGPLPESVRVLAERG
jgi:hypothetical protein